MVIRSALLYVFCYRLQESKVQAAEYEVQMSNKRKIELTCKKESLKLVLVYVNYTGPYYTVYDLTGCKVV